MAITALSFQQPVRGDTPMSHGDEAGRYWASAEQEYSRRGRFNGLRNHHRRPSDGDGFSAAARWVQKFAMESLS
ncbi:hypothetical protein [Bradyrhizobium sp. BR 1432]|uniref:hypothetical protein n=1 Tax=Bradyrhizobium sp. BR 1432 TaxID=3447966 RepID=UPI003EE7B7F0